MKNYAENIIDFIVNDLYNDEDYDKFNYFVKTTFDDFIKNNSLIDSKELLDYVSNILYDIDLNKHSNIAKNKIINLSYIHLYYNDIILNDSFEFFKEFFKGSK